MVSILKNVLFIHKCSHALQQLKGIKLCSVKKIGDYAGKFSGFFFSLNSDFNSTFDMTNSLISGPRSPDLNLQSVKK